MNFSYPALSCMQLGRFAADGLWTPLQAKHRPFSSIGTRNHFRQEQLTILIPEAARELACNQSRPTLGDFITIGRETDKIESLPDALCMLRSSLHTRHCCAVSQISPNTLV